MKDNEKLRKLLKDYGVEDENAINEFINDYETEEEEPTEEDKMKAVFGV